MTVNLMMDEVAGDPEETLRRDPEVRQARAIAEAARSELLNCVSGHHGPVDLAEASRMLAALRTATALAEDAEDRILVHNGLLTSAEAACRAATRHSAGHSATGHSATGHSATRQAGTRHAALPRRETTASPFAGRVASRAAQARLRAARVKAVSRYVLGDPRRAAVTGLVAAATVAGVSVAVRIARSRGTQAA